MPGTAPEETADTVTRLLEEGPLGMAVAAKILGTFRDDKPTHHSTIARWAIRGVKLAGGRVLKLESFQLKGRLCTSKPAIIRFIQAQQVPTNAQAVPTSIGRKTLSNAAQRATAENDAIFGERKPA